MKRNSNNIKGIHRPKLSYHQAMITAELQRRKITRFELAKRTKSHPSVIYRAFEEGHDMTTSLAERMMKNLGLEIARIPPATD